ncbi:hypothetical protein C8J57DRAFT_1729234 [Mycena rebaudengoi]|nr:hypothetical protein C8J57DRAFT_1729234 [Mycena rebaudengoi]
MGSYARATIRLRSDFNRKTPPGAQPPITTTHFCPPTSPHLQPKGHIFPPPHRNFSLFRDSPRPPHVTSFADGKIPPRSLSPLPCARITLIWPKNLSTFLCQLPLPDDPAYTEFEFCPPPSHNGPNTWAVCSGRCSHLRTGTRAGAKQSRHNVISRSAFTPPVSRSPRCAAAHITQSPPPPPPPPVRSCAHRAARRPAQPCSAQPCVTAVSARLLLCNPRTGAPSRPAVRTCAQRPAHRGASARHLPYPPTSPPIRRAVRNCSAGCTHFHGNPHARPTPAHTRQPMPPPTGARPPLLQLPLLPHPITPAHFPAYNHHLAPQRNAPSCRARFVTASSSGFRIFAMIIEKAFPPPPLLRHSACSPTAIPNRVTAPYPTHSIRGS